MILIIMVMSYSNWAIVRHSSMGRLNRIKLATDLYALIAKSRRHRGTNGNSRRSGGRQGM